MSDRRVVGALGALLAAAALALALFTHSWRVGKRQMTMSAGLRSIVVCDDGKCETETYTKFLPPEQFATWVKLGVMTFWFGLGSAAALFVAGVLALMRKPVSMVLSPSRFGIIASALTFFLALGFVFKETEVGKIGYSAWLGLGGAIVGAIAGVMLSRWEKAYALQLAEVRD